MANSGSSSNSFTHSYIQTEDPYCHCSKQTFLLKSWTDEIPGRRFYKCEEHGFFIWADKEKPQGWQKMSLLEARDQIRRQKEEIKELKESLRSQRGAAGDTVGVRGSADEKNKKKLEIAGACEKKFDLFEKIVDEKKKLEIEALASGEREKLLRKFVLISWGGFIVVTAMILTMKN